MLLVVLEFLALKQPPFLFLLSVKIYETPTHHGLAKDPVFRFKKNFCLVVTREFAEYLQKCALELEVYGRCTGASPLPAVPATQGGGGGGSGDSLSSLSSIESGRGVAAKPETEWEREEKHQLAMELNKANEERLELRAMVRSLESEVDLDEGKPRKLLKNHTDGHIRTHDRDNAIGNRGLEARRQLSVSKTRTTTPDIHCLRCWCTCTISPLG